MPQQQVMNSSLLKELGPRLDQACAAHQNEPAPEVQGFGLPGGIDNGVARLTHCRFIKVKQGDNAGKLMWMGMGSILHPRSHKGVTVFGQYTKITVPLYDTPGRTRKTLEEHIAYLQGRLKLLGAPNEGLSGARLEATCAALERAGVTFRFKTFKGDRQVIDKDTDGKFYLFGEKDNGSRRRIKGPWPTLQIAQKMNPYADGREPMVNEIWGDRVPWNEDTAAGGVVDETAPVGGTSPSGVNGSPPRSPTNRLPTEVTEGSEEPADEPEDGRTFNEFQEDTAATTTDEPDLDALAQAADDEGDVDAGDRIREVAEAAGIPQEWVDSDKVTYRDVVERIRQGENPSDTTKEAPAEEPAPQPIVPVKGNVYRYRTSTDKRKKPAEVEVVAIQGKAKTCDVKDLADKKMYKGVAFTALEV